eukprot:jgi/Psemu1/14427/gm1.14427_g
MVIVPVLLAGIFAILLIAKSIAIQGPRDLQYLEHRILDYDNAIPRTVGNRGSPNNNNSSSSSSSSSNNNSDESGRHHTELEFSPPLTTKADDPRRGSKINHNNKNNNHPISVCFVTSQFSASSDRTDHLYDVRKTTPLLHESPLYHFFAFSNLADLKAPGWEVVVQDLRHYKRWITQSRYAKFLAFRETRIRDRCEVVFYMDGILSPKDDPGLFQAEARRILESNVQLAQRLHPYGGGAEAEFERIRSKKKDFQRNVDASLEWLRGRQDYHRNCTLYENNIFGYAIGSAAFQTAADFFWGHYSKEEDSWRDQPLWCYTLDHLDITPLQLTGNGKDVLFDQLDSRTAKGKHTYKSESVVSAATYYESMKHMVSLENSCWLDTITNTNTNTNTITITNTTIASNSSSKKALEIVRGSSLTPICPDGYRRAMQPSDRSGAGLTISIPYFAQPALLLQQLTNFASYPVEIQKELSIVVVDYGSPSGLRAMDHLAISTGNGNNNNNNNNDDNDNDSNSNSNKVAASQHLNTNHTGPPIAYHFGLRVVRINHRIDWNDEGCHNLAFYLSKTRKGLILDLRMLVPVETMRDALAWETTTRVVVDNNNDADTNERRQSTAHKFNRRRPNGELEHQQICGLVDIDEYWNIGGMDEDFAGSYGYGTSPHFWYKWEQSGREVETHDGALLLEQETDACDPYWLYSLEKVKECRETRSNTEGMSKEGKLNRQLWKQKKSDKIPWSNAYLRFNWTIDF